MTQQEQTNCTIITTQAHHMSNTAETTHSDCTQVDICVHLGEARGGTDPSRGWNAHRCRLPPTQSFRPSYLQRHVALNCKATNKIYHRVRVYKTIIQPMKAPVLYNDHKIKRGKDSSTVEERTLIERERTEDKCTQGERSVQGHNKGHGTLKRWQSWRG